MSPRRQFVDLLDSLVRSAVSALNAYDHAPSLKSIDAIRKSAEEHALAFCALGAAFPRAFTPGPTLEQLEVMRDDDASKRDTSPGFKSRFPPAPPPIGEGQPPPLPPRRR